MKRLALALSALLLGSTLTVAHGNFEHVLGTVSKITANSVAVTTATGEVKTVTIVADTKFIKSGAAAGLSDLKVGDRVVIHAKPNGKALEAVEVKFGETPKSPPQH